MDPSDWLLMVLTLGGSVATISVHVSRARARKHLQVVDCRIACPQTGSGVDCGLVRDARNGKYVQVRRCSGVASGPRGADCDQDCLRWLNLGVPLREGEAPDL
jgi:hypothetical protein